MEIGLRLFFLVCRVLLFLLTPILWIKSLIPIKRVPPITDKILLQSGTKLARKIRNNEITSEQIVSSYIARIKAVNPIINAVIEERFNDALKEAKAVDKLIASNENTAAFYENEKPLLGVPITIKESCSVKGMSLTIGSTTRIGCRAEKDGKAVELLRKAGAIPLLVSNVPELCMSWGTNNLLFGQTRNPYDHKRCPGGSSGGEATLISSAASIMGIGSDIGGSIRLPAFSNGVFGHKPSPFLISNDGHSPPLIDEICHEYMVVGPLVRYAEDLSLMLRVMAQEKATLYKLDEKVNIEKLNVFVIHELLDSICVNRVAKEITDAINRATTHLSEIGAKIITTPFADLDQSMEMIFANFASMQAIPSLLEPVGKPEESRNLYLELFKSCFGASKFSLSLLFFYALANFNFFIRSANIPHYVQMRQEMCKIFKENLGDNGILIMPTLPSSANYYEKTLWTLGHVINTLLINTLKLPSTQVPMGLDKDGLPIGFQVVAGPNQDRLCIAVAKELEKTFGGWVPPSQIRV